MDQARLNGASSVAALSFAPFVPRAPWWGGDLQTLSSLFLGPGRALAQFPQQRLHLPLGDGSGDSLAASLGLPADGAAEKPLVLLIHGLSGDESSFYMLRSAAHLLSLGYPVLRLNLRGAGPSRPLCRGHYHAGRSEDLGLALAALPPALKRAGVIAIGYSLGANMLLKYLGEQGTAAPLLAAVAVSAPLDLAGTARRMRRWRNHWYERYLLRDMKVEAVAPAAAVTAAERSAVLAARSIWEFDHLFSAPRHGFTGAEDYYARNSARRFLGGIAIPSLVIHALDDPWIPPDPYRAFDWRSNRNLVPLISRSGGHVGFCANDDRVPWHDRAIARFLDAVAQPDLSRLAASTAE